MILRSYLHTDPAVAISYLFGCGSKAAGAVVDPVEPPDFYLAEAKALGLAIRYVVDTHVHADHVSTGRTLAAAAGAEYVLHESADARYPFRAVRDVEVSCIGVPRSGLRFGGPDGLDRGERAVVRRGGAGSGSAR